MGRDDVLKGRPTFFAMNPFITGEPSTKQLLIFGLITLWTLPWKGLALWRAARLGKKYWFIAFLLIHTLGILEILYLFVFSKKRPHEAVTEETTAPNA